MTEYTVHVQLPDAEVGKAIYGEVLEHGNVSTAILRSGHGTWVSFGLSADSDAEAMMVVDTIRREIENTRPKNIPEGYSDEFLRAFSTAPMVVTHGRSVLYSEGI